MEKEEIFYDVGGEGHVYNGSDSVSWRISSYILVQENGEILVSKQPYSVSFELPGGGANVSESVNATALREFKEETGAEAEILSEIPFYIYESNFYNDGFFRSICLFFEGKIRDKEKLNFDMQNLIKWVPVSDIQKLSLQEMHRKAINKFLRIGDISNK